MEKQADNEVSTEQPGVEVFFPDELKKGVYSNNVLINSNGEEFFLDFLTMAPIGGSVVARIVISPSHAKRLSRALSDSISKYEEKFAEIPMEVKPKNG